LVGEAVAGFVGSAVAFRVGGGVPPLEGGCVGALVVGGTVGKNVDC